MKSGDRMNKYSFSSSKEHLVGGCITKFHEEDGTIVSPSMDLAQLCNIYHSMLYASLTPDAQREECCAEFLRHVPCKFPLATRKVLEASIMEEDFTNSIQAIAKGKDHV
jgi:hypothetical protein